MHLNVDDIKRPDATLPNILRRLNAKALAMVLALVLGSAGVWMVHNGIRDEGSIDLKTAVVEGKLKSGHVGVIVIFFSVIISLACILSKKATQSIEVKKGRSSLKWTGTSRELSREVISRLEAILEAENKDESST